MRKHLAHVRRNIVFATLAHAYCVEVEHLRHERGYRRHGKGKATRYVHLVYLGRQTVHNGQQYTLVAHHHGGVSAVLEAVVLAQPRAYIPCLYVFG